MRCVETGVAYAEAVMRGGVCVLNVPGLSLRVARSVLSSNKERGALTMMLTEECVGWREENKQAALYQWSGD